MVAGNAICNHISETLLNLSHCSMEKMRMQLRMINFIASSYHTFTILTVYLLLHKEKTRVDEHVGAKRNMVSEYIKKSST